MQNADRKKQKKLGLPWTQWHFGTIITHPPTTLFANESFSMNKDYEFGRGLEVDAWQHGQQANRRRF